MILGLCQDQTVLVIALYILCILGFLISAYFTSVYLNIRVPLFQSMAKACRMDTEQCQRVIDFPQARLFRVPNFILGIFYYLALMMLAIFSFPYQGLLIVIAWGVVLASFYLAYALLFILKMPCSLCYTSHVINFCIAIILSFI